MFHYLNMRLILVNNKDWQSRGNSVAGKITMLRLQEFSYCSGSSTTSAARISRARSSSSGATRSFTPRRNCSIG